MNHVWLIAPALMLIPAIAIWLEHRPADDTCSRCHHDAGQNGSTCADVFDNRSCACDDDFHWKHYV